MLRCMMMSPVHTKVCKCGRPTWGAMGLSIPEENISASTFKGVSEIYLFCGEWAFHWREIAYNYVNWR